MSHRNAPLSETGRLRLARCVVDERWPLRRAAERFQVSPTTAARWAGRYRACGEAGMVDRSFPGVSPLGWWGFGTETGRAEEVLGVSLTVLGWAIA